MASFGAMDADGDRTVTLKEALDAVSGSGGSAIVPGAMAVGVETTPAALFEAMRRAQELQDELERFRYGVELAMEGAVAAVDEDGDGKVSVREALSAPGRIASWLGVWREMMARGKL